MVLYKKNIDQGKNDKCLRSNTNSQRLFALEIGRSEKGGKSM